MIHANRIVTVGEQECIIDRPVVLYRGDREVEIEFTLVGNEFTFSEEGNVIKSVNASHGQLVLNTPSGEHMFSELAECHEGKVVFVVTKEMIDEFIEMGFYSFQIRLYDSAEMKSRVTIPPVMNGFDIRNPIAAEDETNAVDQGIVDYARIFKDQSNEELPTFDWQGNYVKTEWAHHDVITENKLNKIEDALYSINANVRESDVVILNTLDQVKKDADAYVKEHIDEVEANAAEFERNLNTDVQKFKTDTNAAVATYKNEVSEELEVVNSQLAHITNKLYISPEDFGAKGDGLNNDYDAFKSLASYCNNIGKNIVISLQGTYKIDKIGQNPLRDNIVFENIEGIKIKGNGSKIICNGEYDAIKHWQSGNYKFSDFHSIAFYFLDCSFVELENFSIDGGGEKTTNSEKTTASNTAIGLYIASCKNVAINNIEVEKYNCDSLVIAENFFSEIKSTSKNVFVKNSRFSYGARNAVTIGFVENVKFDSCVISHGGTSGGGMGIQSPGVGLDIEPDIKNENLISNITFENCIFKDNTWGILTVSGTGVKNVSFCNNKFIDTQDTTKLFSISVTQDNVIFNNNYFEIYAPIETVTNYTNFIKRIEFKNNKINAYYSSAILFASNYIKSTADIKVSNNEINCYYSTSYPIYIQAPIYFNNNNINLHDCTQSLCLLQYCIEVVGNTFSSNNTASLNTKYSKYVQSNTVNNVLSINNAVCGEMIFDSVSKGSYGDNTSGSFMYYNSYTVSQTGVFIDRIISSRTFLFNTNMSTGQPAISVCTKKGYFDPNNVWKANTSYTANSYVTVGSKIYKCIIGGTSSSTGITGTEGDIIDGNITWNYIGEVMTVKTLISY